MQWSKVGELLEVHELSQTCVSIASNRLPATWKPALFLLHRQACNDCCIIDGSHSERRLSLQVGSYSGYGYRQGVGASYPVAGRGGKHGTGGRNGQPGGRRGRGRGGRGRASFGCQGQCWPLPNLPNMPAAATPASPGLAPPCPAPRGPAPAAAPGPMPLPTPPTLPPPAAAPALAFSSNKAAAAALRAQKHKRPTTVPAAMADADSQRCHNMDAQPPSPAPATNIIPVAPVTPHFQHVKPTGSTHQKSGGRTRPVPQRKGAQHQGGQPNPQSSAYPPVGDPVPHQAFLPTPSKRHAPKRRQQGRPAIAAGFGIQQGLNGSGEHKMYTIALSIEHCCPASCHDHAEKVSKTCAHSLGVVHS